MLTEPEIRDRLAFNVRRLLTLRGWTQADLARATKEAEGRVSGLVRAIVTPRADFIAKVAEALRVPVDDLFLPITEISSKSP